MPYAAAAQDRYLQYWKFWKSYRHKLKIWQQGQEWACERVEERSRNLEKRERKWSKPKRRWQGYPCKQKGQLPKKVEWWHKQIFSWRTRKWNKDTFSSSYIPIALLFSAKSGKLSLLVKNGGRSTERQLKAWRYVKYLNRKQKILQSFLSFAVLVTTDFPATHILKIMCVYYQPLLLIFQPRSPQVSTIFSKIRHYPKTSVVKKCILSK